MPELPEVQTTVDGLNETVIGKQIKSLWSDYQKKDHSRKEEIKNLDFWNHFKRKTVGKKILNSKRRGKNILIYLSNETTILVHMKMTGHLLFGNYRPGKKTDGQELHSWKWWGDTNPLQDPFNRFIHFAIHFEDGSSLAFCDSRKFGKVTLLEKGSREETNLMKLGPDAVDDKISLKLFTSQLMKQSGRAIKTVLMDQNIITGIGNIYSDEILWLSGINPRRRAATLTTEEFKLMHKSMRPVLMKGLKLGGDSTSDYRNIYGEHGEFHHSHNAYRLTGKACSKKNCRGEILREVINGRSGHFCSSHQK
jgi:formamidopyrimidine-DNA glycosylase